MAVSDEDLDVAGGGEYDRDEQTVAFGANIARCIRYPTLAQYGPGGEIEGDRGESWEGRCADGGSPSRSSPLTRCGTRTAV